jgi:hypothetical protein
MKKKNIIKKDKALSSIRFCIECGEELEDFSVSKNSSKDAALKQHHNCKKTGKFNGDMCARVYITKDEDENNLDPLNDLDVDEDEFS